MADAGATFPAGCFSEGSDAACACGSGMATLFTMIVGEETEALFPMSNRKWTTTVTALSRSFPSFPPCYHGNRYLYVSSRGSVL